MTTRLESCASFNISIVCIDLFLPAVHIVPIKFFIMVHIQKLIFTKNIHLLLVSHGGSMDSCSSFDELEGWR